MELQRDLKLLLNFIGGKIILKDSRGPSGSSRVLKIQVRGWGGFRRREGVMADAGGGKTWTRLCCFDAKRRSGAR